MFLLLLYYLIVGVGVGEWYVGCEEVLDGCWCWWVKGGGGIEGRCRQVDI